MDASYKGGALLPPVQIAGLPSAPTQSEHANEITLAEYSARARNAGESNELIAIISPGVSQCTQRVRIEQNDSTVFEANPVAGSPSTQLLVDALARHADHLTDLLLGDRNGPAGGLELTFLSEAEQRAGEPARQILQNDLLDLIASPAQSVAQKFDELHG